MSVILNRNAQNSEIGKANKPLEFGFSKLLVSLLQYEWWFVCSFGGEWSIEFMTNLYLLQVKKVKIQINLKKYETSVYCLFIIYCLLFPGACNVYCGYVL